MTVKRVERCIKRKEQSVVPLKTVRIVYNLLLLVFSPTVWNATLASNSMILSNVKTVMTSTSQIALKKLVMERNANAQNVLQISILSKETVQYANIKTFAKPN